MLHKKEHPWLTHKLARILEGWDGYQTGLLHAVSPLKNEQLAWRPAPGRRSCGELVRHICMRGITWLSRMGPPEIDSVEQHVPRWHTDDDGTRRVAEESVPCDDAALLAEWLALSWQPIQQLLEEWTSYRDSGQSGESRPMTSTMADNWPPYSLFKTSTPLN